MTDLPEPEVEEDRPHRPSAIWLIPAAAVIIALTLTVQHYLSKGPTIEIAFPTASGLEAGETPLKYRDVEVGVVEEVNLDASHERVIVVVRLENEIAEYVDADAEFWVVRPRFALGSVSGLETLLSGVYLQGSWDAEPGEFKDEFVGRDEPPLTPPGTPGRRVTLRTMRGGSISPGAPVLYKHVPVGRIESQTFSADGSGVEYQVFVDAPHHHRVTRATKFWSAGGITVTLDADGVTTSVESLDSLLSGGVAFDTLLLDPMADDMPAEITDGAIFRLHANEKEARNSLFSEGDAGVRFIVEFHESVRGLRRGAPVEMEGIRVGEVLEVVARLSETPGLLNIRAVIEVQPRRIGVRDVNRERAFRGINEAVKGGMRAQLKSGNLLTGSLYVDFVRDPQLPKKEIDFEAKPYPAIPSLKSELDSLTGSIQDLTDKILSLPIERLIGSATRAIDDVHVILSKSNAGPKLARVLDTVEQTVRSISGTTEELPKLIQALNRAADAAQRAMSTFAVGSELYFEAKGAVRELREAATAVEALAKTVSEQPNSLLLGK